MVTFTGSMEGGSREVRLPASAMRKCETTPVAVPLPPGTSKVAIRLHGTAHGGVGTLVAEGSITGADSARLTGDFTIDVRLLADTQLEPVISWSTDTAAGGAGAGAGAGPERRLLDPYEPITETVKGLRAILLAAVSRPAPSPGPHVPGRFRGPTPTQVAAYESELASGKLHEIRLVTNHPVWVALSTLHDVEADRGLLVHALRGMKALHGTVKAAIAADSRMEPALVVSALSSAVEAGLLAVVNALSMLQVPGGARSFPAAGAAAAETKTGEPDACDD